VNNNNNEPKLFYRVLTEVKVSICNAVYRYHVAVAYTAFQDNSLS